MTERNAMADDADIIRNMLANASRRNNRFSLSEIQNVIESDPSSVVRIDRATSAVCRVVVSDENQTVMIAWLFPHDGPLSVTQPVLKAAMLETARRFPQALPYKFYVNASGDREGVVKSRIYRSLFPGAVTNRVHVRPDSYWLETSMVSYQAGIDVVNSWP